MTKSNDAQPQNITTLPVDPEPETVEKQSFFQKKIASPIKKHPKIAAAFAGGVALVAGAAYLGRATAPSSDTDYEPTAESMEIAEQALEDFGISTHES